MSRDDAPIYRNVDVDVWDDEKFIDLSSDLVRLVWFELLTGPQTTVLPGLQVADHLTIASTMRKDPAVVLEALRELEGAGMLRFDPKLRVIQLPRAPWRRPPDNPNVLKAWWKAWQSFPKSPLKFAHLDSIHATRERCGPWFDEVWRTTFGTVTRTVSETVTQTVSHTPNQTRSSDPGEGGGGGGGGGSGSGSEKPPRSTGLTDESETVTETVPETVTRTVRGTGTGTGTGTGKHQEQEQTQSACARAGELVTTQQVQAIFRTAPFKQPMPEASSCSALARGLTEYARQVGRTDGPELLAAAVTAFLDEVASWPSSGHALTPQLMLRCWNRDAIQARLSGAVSTSRAPPTRGKQITSVMDDDSRNELKKLF